METVAMKEKCWSSDFEAGNVYDAFCMLDKDLRAKGGSIKDSCIRTWIYMQDIAKDYSSMVSDRARFFEEAGITNTYIASTGIQIPNVGAPIRLAAYSVVGIDRDDVLQLDATELMCHPKEYGVTFERGTRIRLQNRYIYFVSGTASVDKFGKSVHKGSLTNQLDRAMENIFGVLQSGGASLDDLKSMKVYLKDMHEEQNVAHALEYYSGGCHIDIIPAVVCRPELLVEIEGVASKEAL